VLRVPAAEALADHLCALAAELTRHRQGPGPHWLMVETIARELRRHGVNVTGDQAAIAVARVRCVLTTFILAVVRTCVQAGRPELIEPALIDRQHVSRPAG
jgi:hypothetical protein